MEESQVFKHEEIDDEWIEENVTEEKVVTLSEKQEDACLDVDLFWYRKMMFADRYLENEIMELNKYLVSISKKISDKIENRKMRKDMIRKMIKTSMQINSQIPVSKAGAKQVKIPDLGSISLSKAKPTLKWLDEAKVLEAWKDCEKVSVYLNKAKARLKFEETGEIVEGGMEIDFRETLSIRMKI